MVRALHVLSLSADGRTLLLGGDPQGRATHGIPLDDRLARVVRGEHPDGVESPAALSPREIQARLRAGASVEEVAAAAGVPAARVERYAGPVRSEQEQVLRAARAGSVRRARAGLSALPLEQAVARNLGPASADAGWSAARRPDGGWVVQVEATVRGRVRVARWHWDAAGELTPGDPYAGQLGFVPPASAAPAGRRRASRAD